MRTVSMMRWVKGMKAVWNGSAFDIPFYAITPTDTSAWWVARYLEASE